ncbi:choline transporter-like 1 [Dermacentor andersoni]|uniref:choline transporter-like 1 n=1 Tax=Dermacentor andersoni TaxID=34620 RepID=UPI002154F92B|nr:choline transporter-like 1 [Dermacentor andersoni]
MVPMAFPAVEEFERPTAAPGSFKARGCTDLPWLFALACSLGAAVFVASFALALGDPRRLVNGCDSFGNVCGARNAPMGRLAFSGMDLTDRPYLFYLDLADPRNSLKICVSHCPFRALRTMDEVRRFGEETGSSLCRYDVAANNHSALSNATVLDLFDKEQQNTGLGPCPQLPVPPSKPVRNHCVPFGASSDVFHNIYGYLNSADSLQQVVSNLFAAWREVCSMLAFACILSFAVVFLLQRFAELAAKVILILSVLSVMATAAVLWWTYVDIKFHLDLIPFERLLEEAAKNEHAFLIFAIGVTLLAIILLVVAVAMHKHARLAGALFHEAGLCIRRMPFLLVQPVWTLSALVALFTTWTVVFLHLATADFASRETRPIAAFAGGPIDATNLTPVAEVRHFTLVAYDQPSWVRFAWWFQLLFLLWAAEFMLACQQAVIAGAVASWYFCKDRTALVWPLGRSTARLVLYHLGSIALGSILIPVCRIPRLALLAFQHRIFERRGTELQCFNHVIHNAYTVVAIRGTSFCTAGHTAYSVLSESSLSPLVISGDFLLFLAKCLITSVVGLLAVVLLRDNPELQLCAVPVLAVAVFSCVVAHCVLSLYGMIADTLLLCFCEDVLSWEPDHRDLYAPESLHRLLLGDTALLRPLPAQVPC